MAALLRDKKGATIVTYALLLPVFVLLVFGALQVWKVVSIKQSMHLGAYQAVRYLSNEGRNLPSDPEEWEKEAEKIARRIVARELAKGLAGGDANFDIVVHIENPELPKCDWLFSVEVWMDLPWSIVIPYLPSRDMTLSERKSSYIECPSGWTPIPEGPPY